MVFIGMLSTARTFTHQQCVALKRMMNGWLRDIGCRLVLADPALSR